MADFTYIWTDEGWLYFAVVLDLFSRRIVGWSMSETNDTNLVLEALRKALRRGFSKDFQRLKDRLQRTVHYWVDTSGMKVE